MERPNRYGAPDPENLDKTPVEMPLGYTRPTPLEEMIATMVQQVISREKKEEFETPDEADDFSFDDDDLLDLSPYTLAELTEEEPLVAAETNDVQPQTPDPEVDSEPKPTGESPDPDKP